MLMSNSNIIVLLNGPPKVGKNFIGEGLLDHLGISTTHLALMDSAKYATLAAYGLMERGIDIETMEGIKDQPSEWLNGLTWRQALSDVAETFKILYGRDFWAKQMIGKIQTLELELAKANRSSKNGSGDRKTIIFITDPSFPEDIATFERYLPGRILLMRVHRGDRNFGKSSGYEQAYGVGTGKDVRNWLFSDKLPSVDLTNDGNEKQLKNDFLTHLLPFVDLNTFSTERNNKILLLIKGSKKFQIEQTKKVEPFKKPYLIFWPELKTKQNGPTATIPQSEENLVESF